MLFRSGATSGASGGSKRLDTRPLAETNSSQHEQREHESAHVPRPSTPPTINHRHSRQPIEPVDPPHRRGCIKTRSRQVSHTRARKLTHHFERSCHSHIGQPRSDGYTPYTWLKIPTKVTHLHYMLQSQGIEIEHGWSVQSLAEPQLTLLGKCASAAQRDLSHIHIRLLDY